MPLGEGGTGFSLGDERPGHVGLTRWPYPSERGYWIPFSVFRMSIVISVIGVGGDGGVAVPPPPTSVSGVAGVPWGDCRLSPCPSHQCWESPVCLGWSWG